MELLDEVTAPIRRFLCKLHGTTSDHNYEPMSHLLFPGRENSDEDNNSRSVTNQEIVNLVWMMLEELRNVLDASNVLPRQMKHWMDHTRPTRDQSVQTELEVELADEKYVQVSCDSDEFNRRINAFIKRKRAQADAFNRREFCKLHEEGEQFSCARTDAMYVPRRSRKSLLRIDRVHNTAERKDKSPLKMDQLKNWPPTHPSNSLPFSNVPRDIKERIQNLQSVVALNQRVSRFSDVYTLLRTLESRVMYLETLSPEYFNPNPRRMTRKRKIDNAISLDGLHNETDAPSNQQLDNLQLLESRIEELKTRLLERSTKLRT